MQLVRSQEGPTLQVSCGVSRKSNMCRKKWVCSEKSKSVNCVNQFKCWDFKEVKFKHHLHLCICLWNDNIHKIRLGDVLIISILNNNSVKFICRSCRPVNSFQACTACQCAKLYSAIEKYYFVQGFSMVKFDTVHGRQSRMSCYYQEYSVEEERKTKNAFSPLINIWQHFENVQNFEKKTTCQKPSNRSFKYLSCPL